MKRNSGFRIQASSARTACAAICLATMLIGTLGCSSTPSYPAPTAGSGQILVQLNGQAKDGVTGPKKREVRGEYSIERENVEQGRAFERVDYDELEDVVVVLDGGVPILRDVPIGSASAPVLKVTEDGFDRLNIASGHQPNFHKLFTSIQVKNERGSKLTIYGFNEDGDSFEVTVPANGEATAKVSDDGTYEVYCDEDEALHCTWHAVTKGEVWVGPSDEAAFFDNLPPGEYEVRVFPPRLPDWSRTVKVSAGKRETITAELTVNDLPKAK